MSMIGKLRQMSEFDLAKYKKNPGEMVRALAGAQHPGDSAGFATLRDTLQQSPVVKKMIELRQQQKALSREEQAEVQQEMMKLMKQALQMQKELTKISSSEPQSAGRAASEELDLHKSWHCLHFMFTGKVEGSDGTALGDAILGGTENWWR
jgi:isopenicillin N synthase-like dioxygenase